MAELLHPDAIALLALMVEVDEAASRDGHGDTPFRFLLLTNQATFLDHPGLVPNRPAISRRAVLSLRSAGLFEISTESATGLVAYLVAGARGRLDEARQSATRADPGRTSETGPGDLSGGRTEVGDATDPDNIAGAVLRRAHVRRSEQPAKPAALGDETLRVPLFEVRTNTEADVPSLADAQGLTRRQRYRSPGWSDLAELRYLDKFAPRRSRKPGRPKGPYLLQTRAEIEKAYSKLWTQSGRRPYWSNLARELNVDERTLRRARQDFGMDEQVIAQSDE